MSSTSPASKSSCDSEDPTMLWNSYKTAQTRKETEVALERLNTYIRVWVEEGSGSVTPSPMISASSDQFGLLKPCIAFDLPDKAWLLSSRPSGLLTALEEHITNVSRQLVTSLKQLSDSPRMKDSPFLGRVHSLSDSGIPRIELPQLLRVTGHLSTLLARVAGCTENYGELKKSNLVPPSIVYLQCLLRLVKYVVPQYLPSLFHSLNHIVAFLHSMLDPRRHWQQIFMSLHTLSDPSLSHMITVPSLLSDVFVDAFHKNMGPAKEWEEAWLDFQGGLLHMLGAMLCSSNENACLAASQEVSFLLLALLDPRDQCTPLQVLATKVLVKLVHVLYNTVAEETQTAVDCGVMLVGFLNVLSPRFHANGLAPPCVKMVITMMDIVPSLMNPSGKVVSLRNLFVDVGCFEKICEVLSIVKEEAQQSPQEAEVLVCKIFTSFSAVMENSEQLREGFEQRVGHLKLTKLISELTAPTKNILQAGLDMAVEGKYTYHADTHSVYNTSAVAMLINWLMDLNSDLSLWLSDRLFDMCSYGAYNKQRCCTSGLISVVTEVLCSSQEPGKMLREEVEDNLIALVEVLGSHSIRAVELKQLIGLLRPLESGLLPTYYYRLQKALTVMSHRLGKDELTPLHYFDLRTPGSCIYIPELRHFPNSTSLTIHAWVSLDHPRTGHPLTQVADDSPLLRQSTHKRRILYSFYSANGSGFEAFFTSSLVLVVATVTRKEFITLALKNCPLTPLKWHSVSVVYHLPKRPWGRSEVSVYINGELQLSSAMKTPSFTEVYTSSCIGLTPSRNGSEKGRVDHQSRIFSLPGHSPSLSFHSSSSGSFDLNVSPVPTQNNISTSDVTKEWGSVTNMNGLVSTLCMFGDVLSENAIKTLHRRGPNDLSLLQPKCPETADLALKLFVFYHAKAVLGDMCIDLSPSNGSTVSNNGKFTGQHYLTWDIKATLASLGGVELLFPILEQVHLSVCKRECKEEEQSCDAVDSEDKMVLTVPSPEDATKSAQWWFGEKEGVASFLKLLLSMLKGSPLNQHVFFLSEGPATIGALLQKVPPSRITVQTLSAVQDLVEYFADVCEQRCIMYKHLLYDFRIWSRPDFSVRSGHIQYISTIVKDHTIECRLTFGVQYLLDVIRIFYSSMGNTVVTSSVERVELTEEEQQSVRAAILSSIKLYVMYDIHWDEVDSILSFLSAARDPHLLEEILRMLYNLLKTAPSRYVIGDRLWEKGLPLLVLTRSQSMSVRLLAIKILSYLNGQYGDSETGGPIYTALSDGSLAAAIGHMTEHDMSSSIILALLELCVAKNISNCTDYISNFRIYTAVLQLLRRAPLMVRHTICQQVLSMLYHTPTHITDLTASPGWESLFLWLLTPYKSSVPGASDAPVEESKSVDDILSDPDDFVVVTPVTYKALNSLKEVSSDPNEGVRDVSSDPGEGVKDDAPGDNLSDNRLYPIPALSVSGDTTNSEGGGGAMGSGDVEGTVSKRSLHPQKRPLSVPTFRGLSTDDQSDDMRRRSTAFLDSTTKGERNNIRVTKKEVVDEKNRWKSDLATRHSLTYSRCWSFQNEMEEEEAKRTFSVVTETISYLLWNSVDYESGNTPWKVWGKFFSSVDLFASDQLLVEPAHTIKQRVFVLLMHALTMDAKAQEVERNSLLELVLQLSQLLEAFVVTTYPHTHSKEDLDVLLLKLAHNFVPDVDTKHCSVELLQKYLLMLTTAKIFDTGMSGSGVELEIAQSAIRVLLSCVASDDKDYYVASCLKLEHLLRVPALPKQDVFFILSNLVRIMAEAIDSGDNEKSEYISAVVRSVFCQHFSRSELTNQLQRMPSPQSPSFSTEFIEYSESEEWLEYRNGVLKTQEALYNTVLLPWLQTLCEHDGECRQLATAEEGARKQLAITDQSKYNELSEQMYTLHEAELRRQRSVDVQQRNELAVVFQRWKASKRFFTGERGAWSSRREEPYLLKLDRTENFSRMRMRLARNYNFNTHQEASKLRDEGTNPSDKYKSESEEGELLAKVVRHDADSTSLFTEDEEYLLDQPHSDIGGEETTKEKTVKSVACSLIMLMDCVPGILEITTKHIYFSCDQQEKKESQSWYSADFKIPLSQLREILGRRYNMSRTALELFLIDNTNYFLNFPDKKAVQKVRRAVLSQHPPNLNRAALSAPNRLLTASGVTQKWVRKEISNFDYIMTLNTIAGRTYNDLNQYPVFPWVLVDYESETLDLSNPAVFRDLSKPAGAQNPKIEGALRERYEEIDDPTMGKFHFGSHYSNAAGVLHYLIRLEPFTTLHIDLQSGKFDYADRQFFSIPSSWKIIYTSGTDVKELIPEFYYLPEFLKNLNKFDLGQLQNGQALGDVILPPWASSPEDFIRKHREALESPYVSANLHNWIDLIFGYKQSGPEAEKACNVFNYYCYEENVNLETVRDDRERRQIESIINNFGQTPTQLFTEPHPQQVPLDVSKRIVSRGFTTLISRKNVVSLFDHLPTLKAHSVEISERDPVVFVGVPSIQTRALLISGNPEQMVTITRSGLLNVHGWLAFSTSKNKPPFTFQFDPNHHFDRSKWLYLGGPFAPDTAVNYHLFVLSPNNKLLATAGHWDNSFRIHSVDKGRLVARLAHHNDIVTCVALDTAGPGDHLITGSKDTTCAIWKFSSNYSDISNHPLQTLYGHDSEVLCVDISTELDLAVSGAKDGTCLLHTVRQGRYILTLRPREDKRCEVHHVSISSHGRLVVYTEDRSMRQKAISAVPPCIHLYTINGHLLIEKELSECLNTLVVTDTYVITGNVKGCISFRDLYSFQQLNSLNLLKPVHCINVVLDHSTKVITHLLVGLESGKLIIVSPKDLPQ